MKHYYSEALVRRVVSREYQKVISSQLELELVYIRDVELSYTYTQEDTLTFSYKCVFLVCDYVNKYLGILY